MIITIVNNRWLHLDNITPDIDELIYNHFSEKDPNSRYIDSSQQSWDGYYRKYNSRRQMLSKAYLRRLIKLLSRHDIPFEMKDLRDPPEYPMYSPGEVKDDILDTITLMPHQIKGLKACCNKYNEIGTYFYITGAGKTELICGIAKLLKCPTVIIAEETVVVDQIKSRLELRKVTEEVGVFYSGKSPSGQTVCVGSLASILPPKKVKRKEKETIEKYRARQKAYKTRLKNHKMYREMLSQCELLMIDECDKASSNKGYKKLIMDYTQSRYVYGFTGTLPMDDEKLSQLNLQELLGDVISKAERRYLENIGRIIPVKYIMSVFGEKDKDNRTAYDIAVKELIDDNSELHEQVRKIVSKFPDENFVILVEKLDLGTALESLIPNSKFLQGSTRKSIRDKTIKDFEDKKLQVLIGSKILKRGLDLKGGIDNLILCASSAKDSELEQKVGRAVRLNSRGWARVFDFMFINNYYLYTHSRRRLKRMVQLGYPTIVAAPKKILDGKRVIRPGFNLFRYV